MPMRCCQKLGIKPEVMGNLRELEQLKCKKAVAHPQLLCGEIFNVLQSNLPKWAGK